MTGTIAQASGLGLLVQRMGEVLRVDMVGGEGERSVLRWASSLSTCTSPRFSPMMFTIISRGPRMSVRVELMTYNEEIYQVAMTSASPWGEKQGNSAFFCQSSF